MDLRKSRGTTLIELLAVLGLLGLAMSISAPNIQTYMQTQKLERTYDQMASHLDLARQRAIARHNPFECVLGGVDDNRYWIHDDENSNGAVEPGEEMLGPFQLPSGIAFSNIELLGDGRLVFLPSGMLRVGEGGTITLVDNHQREKTLEVMASGMVSRS
jgi:Tfp pilus assembly protein FimT